MKAIKLRQQAFYQGHFKSGIRILTTGIKMGVTPCKCETKVPSSVDQVEARGHGPHGRWAGAKGYSYFSRSNFWQSGAAAAENSPIAHRLSPERARMHVSEGRVTRTKGRQDRWLHLTVGRGPVVAPWATMAMCTFGHTRRNILMQARGLQTCSDLRLICKRSLFILNSNRHGWLSDC